eukprot:gnl/Carplike_NY0171/3894_a5253_395.p1 GENE.gnl/Carplike_NY0171/3894_a5253_395~~gnl/Carplike_NY0171/3894_a5253_395.p1  ORF type:complete len:114 (+),score=5.49 gnl/Carplike_NY0171/3894_a5253_395:28-369(+)
MNDLYLYVSLIKNSNSDSFVVDRTSTGDVSEADGVLTEYIEQTVTFENGVIIKQCVEFEQGEVAPDVVCAECWISYEVLSEPSGLDIWPKRKSFVNQCQEAFWLKMSMTHKAT